MSEKKEPERSPTARRELTPSEHQRIRVLNEKGGEENLWNKYPDFVEATRNEDGSTNVRPAVKEDLGPQNGPREMAGRVFEATGFNDFMAGFTLIVNTASALVSKDAPLEEIANKCNMFGRMMASFQPRDAIEGMLISQALATQERAMKLLHSAAAHEYVDAAQKLYNTSSKLLARSQAALQQLASYRRAGQQRCVVEHVHVGNGGRAAFGHFESHQGGGGVNQRNVQGTP